MHRPQEGLPRDALDTAADTVIHAFVDSFVQEHHRVLPEKWLKELIDRVEDLRYELLVEIARSRSNGAYVRNLAKLRRRVEVVLSNLYEEQLHY